MTVVCSSAEMEGRRGKARRRKQGVTKAVMGEGTEALRGSLSQRMRDKREEGGDKGKGKRKHKVKGKEVKRMKG